MKILISSPKGKEKLVGAFEKEGVTVVKELTPDTQLLIPTVDEELPFFSTSRSYFESLGIRVPVASPEVIDICRNKRKFNQFCLANGFAIPRVFPEVFVRPVYGKGNRGTRSINKDIVQEFMYLPEFSIDYFADYNGNPVSVIPRQRVNVINGESHAANFAFSGQEILTKVATELGYKLRLVGPNVIQCFFSGQIAYFTEVNPRFGGGSWLSFHLFNSPKWLLSNCI